MKLQQDALVMIIMKHYVKTYLYSSNVTILPFFKHGF